MRLDAFPRYPLLFGPSPVHPLERLSAHLGGARIWAKRDDCNSGLGVFFDTVIVCSVTGSTQAGVHGGRLLDGEGAQALRLVLRVANQDLSIGHVASSSRHGWG